MDSQSSPCAGPQGSALGGEGPLPSESEVSKSSATNLASDKQLPPCETNGAAAEGTGGVRRGGSSVFPKKKASLNAPLFRPKKTCAGLEEALRESGRCAEIHWSSAESLHVHVNPPSPAAGGWDDSLSQSEKREDVCGGDFFPHSRGGGQGKTCIPCFSFAPKLSPHSEGIVLSLRSRRVQDLWAKIDGDQDGCADLFDLKEVAPLLLPLEKRFLKVLILALVEQAVSRSNRDALLDGGSLGARFDPSCKTHTQRPTADGPVRIATLPPNASLPADAREDREGLAESGEAENDLQTQLEERASRVYRRLAREFQEVVLLNADPKIADASARPMLFVPRERFVRAALDLLSSCFGASPAVDSFREEIMKQTRRLAKRPQDVEGVSQLFKPHILRYSRKLDAQRHLDRQRAKATQEGRLQRRRKEALLTPVCGDRFCCVEETRRIKQRSWHRFDDQIRHFVRKRMQLEHLKRALDDARDAEVATFHPKINDTPRYLTKLRSERIEACGGAKALAEDPMGILREFCNRFVPDDTSSRVVEALKECSFQPNAAKFVAAEARRQRHMEEAQAKLRTSSQVLSSQQQGVCCQGKEASAKADALFQMLDRPFDAVFTGSIRKWLRADGVDWISRGGEREGLDADEDEDADQEGGKKKAASDRGRQGGGVVTSAEVAARRWEVEGRDPQHRRLREMERRLQRVSQSSKVECKTSSSPVEAPKNPAGLRSDGLGQEKSSVGRAKQVKPQRERWEESLRGGYASPYLNFSNDPPEPLAASKLRAAKQGLLCLEKWEDSIRIKARGLEARVVEGSDVVERVVEDFAPSLEALPPTLWIHRRRRVEDESRHLGAAGRRALPLLKNTPPHAQAVPSTVFAVPTPPKRLQTRSAYELYTQVRHEVESGAVKIPPKIVGVRRDRLADIEAQLKTLPPLILLAAADDSEGAS